MSRRDKDCIKGTAALMVFVVLIVIFIVSMVLSNKMSSKDTLGSFVIRPGEQVLKCSSKRLLIDHNSKDIKAYESFGGIPEISTGRVRDFRLTYDGSVRMAWHKAHSFFLTPGSYVRVIANTGTSTGSVMVLRGEVDMKKLQG